MKYKGVLLITQTALMLALLIAAQYLTRSLHQLVTGSVVNLILLLCVFLVGLSGGIAVAILSPFLAFLAGIGPAFIQIVPFIAVSNAILVLIAYTVRRRILAGGGRNLALAAAVMLAGGAAKTIFLWVGLVVIALPFIPGLDAAKLSVVGAAFTWPQMVTASIGTALAVLLTPVLGRALKRT